MQSQLIQVTGIGGETLPIEVVTVGQGPALLFLHGAGGLLAEDPFLAALGAQFTVHAPLLPGFGQSQGEEHLRDMLDFTLHGFDVAQALGLQQPVLVGHSLGGMIAAEMAAVAPQAVRQLVLLGAAGLWLDDEPAADLFTKLPFELPALLFHDPHKHGNLLSAGGNLDDAEFLTTFLVENSRRMSTASKLLFPIPERGLSNRLYRITTPTQVMWGASDRIMSPRYAEAFGKQLPNSSVTVVEEAGHMLPYEQTETVVQHITAGLS